MLNSYSMTFDGDILKRGFWLYVWEIKGTNSHHLYVGRTGDSSSANASSPFKRIGQHLDPSPRAKGNALGKQLRHAGIDCGDCMFEMTAIGPIFTEQSDFGSHIPFRDKMAAIERAVSDELKRRSYIVLGTHPRIGTVEPNLLGEITSLLDRRFPAPPHPGL